MQFFNPKVSTITFSVSIAKGTIQIAMARTVNPSFNGRPEKGQRMYDWENTVYFSLQPIECVHILENINNILNGTYVNHREKDERFKKCITLTHFRNNQPSRLLIDHTKDQSGNHTGSILMSIIPPQDIGRPVTYAFRHEEMKLTTFYLDHGAKNLSFYKDLYDANEKIKFAKDRKSQGNQQQDRSQNNQGYDNNGYNDYSNGNQQSTFDNPTTSNQNIQAQQNVDDVSKINMGW